MKKLLSFLMLGFGFAIIMNSCKPEVKKEVIVVPAPAPIIIEKTTPAPIIIEKAAPEKGTTITLDKNGVKVESKKVGVTIKNQ